jgi:DNA (cytosine-5)-methyltransferase 1
MNTFLGVAEVAEEIGISPDTVRRWEKKGLIKSHRNVNNYRVFSVDEIKRLHSKINGASTHMSRFRVLKARKKSRYTAIDLFAGAGGTALGLEHAGFRHIMLNEFDKNAAATLRKNKPSWNIIESNIANVDFRPYKGYVDVIEGGFPCQSFSYAGRKRGFEDARGTLFYEFARAVKEAEPKIAIGENVKGLLTHDGGRTLQTMVKILEELGYRVQHKVMRSQYLDVPQKRERLVIFAVRKDINVPIYFPEEHDYTISLREAFQDCPVSEGQEYSPKKKKIMDLIPPGGYWRDLPLNLQKEYMMTSFNMGGGKTGMARRLSWDEPSLTLTCNPAQKQTERCHPAETRPLTVREYARIQTFPDDWQFAGSVSAQYKQIGNAVPVNLGYYIGLAAIRILDAANLQTVEKYEFVRPIPLEGQLSLV